MTARYCDQCGVALTQVEPTQHQGWCPKNPKNQETQKGEQRIDLDELDQVLTVRTLYRILKGAELKAMLHSQRAASGIESDRALFAGYLFGNLCDSMRDMAAPPISDTPAPGSSS